MVAHGEDQSTEISATKNYIFYSLDLFSLYKFIFFMYGKNMRI